MFNRETGKHEIKKVFKSTGEVVVGTGDTKEEARKDLYAKLEEGYRIPMSKLPGYRGPKWAPKMVVVGYVNSPGFVKTMDDNGKVAYEFKADRKAQVLASPATAKTIGARIAKTEGNTET